MCQRLRPAIGVRLRPAGVSAVEACRVSVVDGFTRQQAESEFVAVPCSGSVTYMRREHAHASQIGIGGGDDVGPGALKLR